MPRCNRCKVDKLVSDFYFNYTLKKPDYMCKVCKKEYARDYNAKVYFKTSKGKQAWARNSLKAYKKFPEKWRARAKLRYAVKIGEINKPLYCEIVKCASKHVQGHHYKGYGDDHIYDVQWLCPKHHSLSHYPLTKEVI